MMKKACLPRIFRTVGLWGVLALSGIFLSPFSYAQELWDQSTQEVAWRAVRAIYAAILEAKPQHQELSAFDERVLSTNPDGVQQILYQYQDPRISQKEEPYQFLITIGPLKEKPAPPKAGPHHRPAFEARHYGFPLIGVRVSYFVKRYRRGHYYDLDQAVQKGLDLLHDHQQRYFPFEVILRPLKESFKVGERIAFEVTVKNKTNQNLKIKNLGEKTLFFTINGQEWGTRSSVASRPGQEEYVLGPHDSVSRSFRGDSFRRPGEVNIFCTYHLAYKGILPFGTLMIKIEE